MMPTNQTITETKLDFIDDVRDMGYEVNIVKSSIIDIIGKDKRTIRCNLKTTRNVKTIGGALVMWYGIRTTVVKDVNYVIFFPYNTLGFYIVPGHLILKNLSSFFNNPNTPNYYTFQLAFSDDYIYGKANMPRISILGMLGMTQGNIDRLGDKNSEPKLPFFPPPVE